MTSRERVLAALRRQTPDRVPAVLYGEMVGYAPPVMEMLKEQGGEEIILLVGGIIPEEDRSKLKEMGVLEVFTSGTDINQVVISQ